MSLLLSVITLEETERPALCSRIIRFYCYASGDYLELDTALLDPSASRLAAAPAPRRSARTFSPSLCSFCPSQRILALADDTQIKLFDLGDIFLSARPAASGDPHAASAQTDEECEPGACAHERQSCPVHGQVPPSAAHAAPSAPHGAHGISTPHFRKWPVRVYSPQPVVTLLSPFSIRHLDFKQHYLSFSSANETRLLCLRLAKQLPRGRSSGEREREEAERERERHEARMPTSRALSRSGSYASLPSAPAGGVAQVTPLQRSRAPSTHRRGVSMAPSIPAAVAAPVAAIPSNQPLEQIGVRCIDDELRLQLRPDMYARECSLVMHRRFSPADQIHTVRLISSLDDQVRRDGRANRTRRGAAAVAGVTAGVSAAAVAAAVAESPSRGSLRPPARSLSQSPVHSSPTAAAPSASVRNPPTVRQELFAQLGQGLAAHAFPASPPTDRPGGGPSRSSSFYAASMGGNVGAPPIFVELLDEEEEGGAVQQARIAGLIQRLEELEDDAEAEAIRLNGGYPIPSPAAPDAAAGGTAAANCAPSSDSSSSSSSCEFLRSNGCVDGHVRLLLSTSEECSLYDVEADVRLGSYVFEHDLVSLHARSSFLFALTTAGLEVHSLWAAHPIMHFFTLPLICVREEPVAAKGADPTRKMQDMLLLDDWIVFRHSPATVHSRATSSALSIGGGGGASSIGFNPSLLSSSPPPRLIVATADTDPCESWPTFPVRALPSVTDVVRDVVQPLALRSMKSSREATPSAIRLFSEALLMLAQRHSQLRSLVRQRRRAGGAGSSALSKLQSELAAVSQSLSSTNAFLSRLFLSSRELGLSCYFSYYQHETPLPQLWADLNTAVASSAAATAAGGATSDALIASHSHFVTKFLIKLLLHPTRSEQSLLLSSPALVSAFVSHFGAHAPHLLGSVLLKTFLLHCPYDPRLLLRILEEHTQSGNFDSAAHESTAASGGDPYKSSRAGGGSDSRSRSPSPSSSSFYGAVRMRPIVFNTFVQALMHLQIQSMSMAAAGVASPTAGGGGAHSGRDCASILLNSFSGQSLEYLLVTYSSLLTTWAHRALLIDFLRSAVPWSLLEVLVVLTQRGEIHVHTAIGLLIGEQAAAAILAPSTTTVTTAASVGSLLSPRPSSPSAVASAALSSTSPQLCAYLEASLNPFMLTQEAGAALESDHAILPWEDEDAPEQAHFARADAPTSGAAASPDDAAIDEDDVSNPNAPFVPMHVREANKLPSGLQMATRAGAGTAVAAQSISRGQIACLAEQLACLYLQQEIAELQQQSSSLMQPPSNRAALPSPAMRRMPSYSYSPLSPLSAPAESRHELSRWWRSQWLDQLGGPDACSSDSHHAQSTVALLSPRLCRLQALLCGPLPLSRRHFERIYALLRQLPSRASSDQKGAGGAIDPVRLSLLLLVLPRVGRLAAALRLVVAHAPECTWPFALIYCGSGGSSGVAHAQLQQLVSQPSLTADASWSLLHWQLLHAVLLLHIFYSTHSQAVLLTHSLGGSPSAGAVDEAKGRREPLRVATSAGSAESSDAMLATADDARAKQLLSGLLSPVDIDQLLRPLDAAVVGPVSGGLSSSSSSSSSVSPRASAESGRGGGAASYSGAMAHLSAADRAALFADLYVRLVDQLVQRHAPSQFLSFIPQAGSSAFYLPYVQRNLALHAATLAASKHAALLAQDAARRHPSPTSVRASASAHSFGGL